MTILEEVVLKKYLSYVMRTKFPEAIQKGQNWNFRCNVCGDSKKSKKKKRGNIFRTKDGTNDWIFHCFNCNAGMKAHFWMKEYFPEFYQMYIRESLRTQSSENQYIETNQAAVSATEEKVEEQPRKDDHINKGDIISIKEDDMLCGIARDFIMNRLVPDEIWRRWYVGVKGTYCGRMIIPFFDREGKITYWQARALNSEMIPKYINPAKNRDNAIYNLPFINIYKEVIVTEGVIDSIFCENSVAVLGTKWSEKVEEKLNRLSCFYIIDHENNKDTKAVIKKLLSEHKYLFNWKKFMKANNIPEREKWDINDLYIYMKRSSKFTFEELKKYFTNSFYDRIYFQ